MCYSQARRRKEDHHQFHGFAAPGPSLYYPAVHPEDCGDPQHASIATATQKLAARRLSIEICMCYQLKTTRPLAADCFPPCHICTSVALDSA
jgi:hypothetical protein